MTIIRDFDQFGSDTPTEARMSRICVMAMSDGSAERLSARAPPRVHSQIADLGTSESHGSA